jgi:hypothetical protein
LGVLVASPVYRAAGQQAARATPPPAAATLRRAFNAGCAAELELVRAEMQRNDSEHTGGRYWLAHVRPKRTGSFQLKYKYRDNNPSYTHGERELPFTVGPKGCRRGPLGAAAYTYVCLGDTIILPIALDDYAGHTFNITRTPYQPELWESVATARPPEENNKLDRSPVANPAADYLQYVGRSVHQSSHRAGGYTLNFYAVFEARKPGRLNLALMGDSASFGLSGSVPILIIEPGTPLTLLPAREEVEQYDEGPPP